MLSFTTILEDINKNIIIDKNTSIYENAIKNFLKEKQKNVEIIGYKYTEKIPLLKLETIHKNNTDNPDNKENLVYSFYLNQYNDITSKITINCDVPIKVQFFLQQIQNNQIYDITELQNYSEYLPFFICASQKNLFKVQITCKEKFSKLEIETDNYLLDYDFTRLLRYTKIKTEKLQYYNNKINFL